MMEEKEILVSRNLKRKSVLDIDGMIQTKRQTNYLLDDISKNDLSMSSVENYCETPDRQNKNQYASCLTEPFKVGFNLIQEHTPKERILSLSEFFKLPKPELCKSIEQTKDLKLERAPTEILNDSFEKLQSQLYKSHTYTPTSFGMNDTPETPCDLHDIDIDNMGTILSLGRNSLIDYNIPPTYSLSSFNKYVHNSPMIFENDRQHKVAHIRRIQSEKPAAIAPVCHKDDNRIEYIEADIVSKIIENDFTSKSYAYHIIDCRYPYEYDGGHINGAVNLYTPYQMLSYVFLSNYDMKDIRRTLDNPEESLTDVMNQILSFERPQSHWKHKAFIFHCEFSSMRGPDMAQCLRNMDRWANWSKYPQLYFPKVYIMTKGYKEFFSKYKTFCKPYHYVKMDIVDPNREKGQCMAGESDDEDLLNNSSEMVDQETVKRRLKMYNSCKRESQEQYRLCSQIFNSKQLTDGTTTTDN